MAAFSKNEYLNMLMATLAIFISIFSMSYEMHKNLFGAHFDHES